MTDLIVHPSSDCRSAFEKWFLGENPTITDKKALERSGADSIYDLMTTRINWLAFEAGWNARPQLENTELQEALASSLETNKALSKKLMILKDACSCLQCWEEGRSDD